MGYTKGDWRVSEGADYVVVGGGFDIKIIASCISRPDAQLIASAPRLLEKLKDAATAIHNSIRYSEGEYREFLQAELKEISAVIVKADRGN